MPLNTFNAKPVAIALSLALAPMLSSAQDAIAVRTDTALNGLNIHLVNAHQSAALDAGQDIGQTRPQLTVSGADPMIIDISGENVIGVRALNSDIRIGSADTASFTLSVNDSKPNTNGLTGTPAVAAVPADRDGYTGWYNDRFNDIEAVRLPSAGVYASFNDSVVIKAKQITLSGSADTPAILTTFGSVAVTGGDITIGKNANDLAIEAIGDGLRENVNIQGETITVNGRVRSTTVDFETAEKTQTLLKAAKQLTINGDVIGNWNTVSQLDAQNITINGSTHVDRLVSGDTGAQADDGQTLKLKASQSIALNLKKSSEVGTIDAPSIRVDMPAARRGGSVFYAQKMIGNATVAMNWDAVAANSDLVIVDDLTAGSALTLQNKNSTIAHQEQLGTTQDKALPIAMVHGDGNVSVDLTGLDNVKLTRNQLSWDEEHALYERDEMRALLDSTAFNGTNYTTYALYQDKPEEKPAVVEPAKPEAEVVKPADPVEVAKPQEKPVVVPVPEKPQAQPDDVAKPDVPAKPQEKPAVVEPAKPEAEVVKPADPVEAAKPQEKPVVVPVPEKPQAQPDDIAKPDVPAKSQEKPAVVEPIKPEAEVAKPADPVEAAKPQEKPVVVPVPEKPQVQPDDVAKPDVPAKPQEKPAVVEPIKPEAEVVKPVAPVEAAKPQEKPVVEPIKPEAEVAKPVAPVEVAKPVAPAQVNAPRALPKVVTALADTRYFGLTGMRSRAERLGQISQTEDGLYVALTRNQYKTDQHGAMDMNLTGLRVGGEKALSNQYGTLMLGTEFSVDGGSAKIGQTHLDNRAKRAGAAIFATQYLSNNAYVETTVGFNKLATKLKSESVKVSSQAVYAGLEYGQRFDLGDGWFVTPQAQMQYTKTGSSKADDLTFSAVNSMQTRLGTSVGRTFGTTVLAADFNVIKEWTAKQTVTTKDGTHRSSIDYKSAYMQTGLSAQTRIGRAVSLYSQAGVRFGGQIKPSVTADVGVRYSF